MGSIPVRVTKKIKEHKVLLYFFGDALRARTPERSEVRRFAILRSKMTALTVKQNSAFRVSETAIPVRFV